MKIVICLPGTNFNHKTMMSIIDLTHSMKKNGIDFVISCCQSPVIYYVRNMCLCANNLNGKNQKPFNGDPYDYTLWIDSDIVFDCNQILRLLSHEKNIVSGIYKMSDNYNYATVIDWNIETFKKKGCFDFINDDSLKNLDKSKLLEVSYTGFGFILIKQGVFEKIGYPYFKPKFYEIKEIGFMDFLSEDSSFCFDARDAGFKTYVDLNVRVGHYKSFVI